MTGLVRISEAASIGVHATLWMARYPQALCVSSDVCRLFGFSVAHFTKVMQALAKAGIVESVRGPRGGTRLSRDPAGITLLEVFEAIEGGLAADRCLLSPKLCPTRCCPIGREIDGLNRRLLKTLADATLRSMSKETDWISFTGRTDTPRCIRKPESKTKKRKERKEKGK